MSESYEALEARVHYWLATQRPQSPTRVRDRESSERFNKRKRDYPLLSSPPPTESSNTRPMPSSLGQKRWRRAQDLNDDDVPSGSEIGDANQQALRSTSARQRTNIIATAPSIDAANSPSSRSVSYSPSPSEKLTWIGDSFNEGKLPEPGFPIPDGLKVLIEKMERVSLSHGFLPASAQNELIRCGLDFPEYIFAPTDETLSWMSPSAAKNIVSRAIECELRHEDETSWNMEVHYHLLREVCRPQGRAGLVDFMSCTTARIAPTWCPRSAPSKMVDFCFYINPAYDPEFSDLPNIIDALRSELPSSSINHTDYRPLWAVPMGPSVETKKGSDDGDKALLQLGTWQTAQLRAMAALERQQTMTAASASSVTALAFTYFPGIIVRGQQWDFVVTTTREKAKPAVLLRIIIGCTDTELGVYKVATALEYLARWCRDVYWPLYKVRILQLPSGNLGVGSITDSG